MTTNKLKRVVATAATFAVITAMTVVPAFADTFVGTDGNGANSNSTQTVSTIGNTVVSQQQQANISNNISGKVNTGGNSSSDNTGGGTFVSTGNAGSDVSIMNKANSASAVVGGSNNGGNTWSQITGNGFGSGNSNAVTSNNSQQLFQNDTATFANTANTDVNSGKNSASDNTGGATQLTTGQTFSGVNIQNMANNAQGVLGGFMGDTTGGLQKSVIGGNGAYATSANSENNTNSTLLEQTQNATFSNNVGGSVNSGWNNAGNETNGNTMISTGGVGSTVNIGNAANNAWAALGGAGSANVTTATTGNGFGSNNSSAINSQNSQSAYQTNSNTFANAVNPDITSGWNQSAANTGSFYWNGDPTVITTGAGYNQTTVVNEANQSTVSNGSFSLPGGWAVNFGF